MNKMKITYRRGWSEPVFYYNIAVSSEKEPADGYCDHRQSHGNEIDVLVPLAAAMAYLHLHPVEKVELDEDTSDVIKPKLEIILEAHNAAIANLGY